MIELRFGWRGGPLCGARRKCPGGCRYVAERGHRREHPRPGSARTKFLSAAERAPQPWQIDRLVVETPDPVSSARWLSRVLGTTLEAGTTNVPLEGANVEFRVGDSDRVTRVLIGGSNPPSGEVAGLSVDAG